MQEILDTLLLTLNNAKPHHSGLKACCPFHDERTGSFFVFQNIDDGYWYYKCFGCDKSGSLKHLLFKLQKGHLAALVETPNPALWEAKKKQDQKIQKEITDYTLGFPTIYTYYNDRGISDEVVDLFGFKFDIGNDRTIFPIYMNHRYQGYISRHLSKGMRYQISTGMDLAKCIWGYDTIDKTKDVYLVEGIIDAATLWTHNHQAIALCNKSWRSRVDLLKKLPNLIIIPDNDQSGIKTFSELGLALNRPLVYLQPEYKDVNDFYLQKKSPLKR